MRKPKAEGVPAREWPADKVERRAVADLVPYARNARTHSAEQVAQIAASMKEFGFTVPVLLDEAGGIIAGHGRIMAAKSIGLESVPCMVARGWSKAQKAAYVLADNKLALNAGWDDAMLKLEFADLKLEGFDLTLVGFSGPEIELVMTGWGAMGDPRDTDGSHLDGISTTIKVVVAQAVEADARAAIKAALNAASIVYE